MTVPIAIVNNHAEHPARSIDHLDGANLERTKKSTCTLLLIAIKDSKWISKSDAQGALIYVYCWSKLLVLVIDENNFPQEKWSLSFSLMRSFLWRRKFLLTWVKSQRASSRDGYPQYFPVRHFGSFSPFSLDFLPISNSFWPKFPFF